MQLWWEPYRATCHATYLSGPKLQCKVQLRMPHHTGHRLKWVQAHSGLPSGSEHIHKGTHIRGDTSVLPTATTISFTSSVACALHRKADTQSQQLVSFCVLQIKKNNHALVEYTSKHMNIHFCLPFAHGDIQQKHKCTHTLQVTITNATEKLLSPEHKTWLILLQAWSWPQPAFIYTVCGNSRRAVCGLSWWASYIHSLKQAYHCGL